MDFKSKLKKLRINQKMTQETVAQKAGIPLRTYISYERGVTPQKRETYEKLSTALECSVEELILDSTKTESTTKTVSVAGGAALVGALAATSLPVAVIMVPVIGIVTLLKSKSPHKQITALDIENMLNEKLRNHQASLEKKKVELARLQGEIDAEDLNIQKCQAALSTLDLNEIANEVNTSTQQEELNERN